MYEEDYGCLASGQSWSCLHFFTVPHTIWLSQKHKRCTYILITSFAYNLLIKIRECHLILGLVNVLLVLWGIRDSNLFTYLVSFTLRCSWVVSLNDCMSNCTQKCAVSSIVSGWYVLSCSTSLLYWRIFVIIVGPTLIISTRSFARCTSLSGYATVPE